MDGARDYLVDCSRSDRWLDRRRIMKGGGYGVIADIRLGIVGGIVGGWVVGLPGFGPGGMIWSILVAILGAVILIWITRLIKKEA